MFKFLYYVLLVFLFLFFSTGCSVSDYQMFAKNSSSFRSLENNASNSLPFRYKVQVHDRISIMFYGHPELSTRTINSLRQDEVGILVNSKFIATFPLIGDVNLTNVYQEDLAKILEKKYENFTVTPHINAEIINKHVVVLGEVRNPGAIDIQNETMNLFEAISRSGGLTKSGKRSGVIILRAIASNPALMHIDLTDAKSILAHNLTLEPNDIVYISPNANIMIEQALPTATIIRAVADAALVTKLLAQ